MDLNFIIFPAPKCSYSEDLTNGELIWIPKQDKEHQQKQTLNSQDDAIEQNYLKDGQSEFSATKNKNFGSHQKPIEYRTKHVRQLSQPNHFYPSSNFEEIQFNDESSNRQFYSVSSQKQFQNQSSTFSYFKLDDKQSSGVIDQQLLNQVENQKQAQNQMNECSKEKQKNKIKSLAEVSNKSSHEISYFEQDIQNDEENMQMDCNEYDEMDSKISSNIKPDSITQYSFSKPQQHQKSLETSTTSTQASILKQKSDNTREQCQSINTQQIKKAQSFGTSKDKNNQKQNKSNQYLPCLFLNSDNYSPNYLLYFHGNGEDINLSYDLLSHLKNNLEVNIIAMEYPGYGMYQDYDTSIDKADLILSDALYLYDYLTQVLGIDEKKMIIFGRSIGSGPATHVAAHRNPGSLALMSAFTSLRQVASDLVGKLMSYALKERFNNLENIKNVTCPSFIVHGQCDKLISFNHSLSLFQNCGGICQVNLPKEMTHIEFDFYEDFSKPLIQFLQKNNFNLYNYLPQYDFSFPQFLFQNPKSINKQLEESKNLIKSKVFNQFNTHKVYYTKLKTSCC